MKFIRLRRLRIFISEILYNLSSSAKKRTGMELDYDQLAAGYDAHRRGSGPYFDALLALAKAASGTRVLEIGAGTGNNTAALLDAHSCRLTALEPSREMLQRGHAKKLSATWIRATGMALPFRRDTFHFLFGTYMLHHVPDLPAFFKECHRVLTPRGIAAFVTVPQEFIANHPMNDYFPSFAKIDLARFQPVPQAETALRAAGFHNIQSRNTIDQPRPIDYAYSEKIAGKFISTYDLLPPEEFAQGVRRLRADVSDQGALERPMAREATLAWGRKSRKNQLK